MKENTNQKLMETVSFNAEKITNEIEEAITQLEYKIVELKTMRIEPDLSYLNSFYREKTEENIKRINSRLKVPRLNLYIWLSSFAMLIISLGVFFFVFSKIAETKAETRKEYKEQLLKGNVIISQDKAELLKDMDLWFKSDPESTAKFIRWRLKQK